MTSTYREPGASTVLGVPLQPGERVLYWVAPDTSSERRMWRIASALVPLGAVAGAAWELIRGASLADAGITLVVYFGLGAFLVGGVRLFTPRTPKAQIVTDQRILVVDHRGRLTTMALTDAASLRAERTKGSAGRGGDDALSVAITVVDAVSAVSTALDNRAAEKQPMLSADHWQHTTAIEVIGEKRRLSLTTSDARTLGPLLARLVIERSADREPAIPYDA
jgi:hypothetical protein